ncbi:MAG: glycosyltransferase family 2 protein [Rhodocyclales bacterium]|nr:glycosyltransferase family 2 protein [Rhodocyclales bacterium]
MPDYASPLISVCVPTYNGYPYIADLVRELLGSPRMDFEIVISDDCSSDETWDFVVRTSQSDPRLKCFRNEANLGMDRNFAASVARARGQYVWLTGQDDRIFHQGIDAVATFILQHPDIEFLHLNYTRVEEGKGVGAAIEPVAGSEHRFGTGLESFLARTDGWLPTFLPLFVMKKALWDRVDVSRYFDTCFCQVGVFLECSRDLRWCHMDGNYVVGLTPVGGWQFKPLGYARIVFGNYVMLDRAERKCDWLGPGFIAVQYRKILGQLVYAIIMLRAQGLQVGDMLLQDMKAAVSRVPYVSFAANALLRMPGAVARLAVLLIKGRRVARSLRSRLAAVLSRAPAADLR